MIKKGTAVDRCIENWETAYAPFDNMVQGVQMLLTTPKEPFHDSVSLRLKEQNVMEQFSKAMDETDISKAIGGLKKVAKEFSEMPEYIHTMMAGNIDRAVQELTGYQRSLQSRRTSMER